MELTARENIFLNGALLGYSKKFIQDNFDDIGGVAEIETFLDMPLKNYSSGMVARIAFAIATVIVPDILIVDEVLSVGDFMFQKKCEERIQSLIKEHNVTVLIVSHNNDQIERLCNKAVWIEKGHMRMLGTAHDVCQTYRVLGGHTGDKESEDCVFETLTSPVVADESIVKSIEADTPYALAARLNSQAYENGADTAIVIYGEYEMEAFLAAGLAGALDAPTLLTKSDNVPDATSQEDQTPQGARHHFDRKNPVLLPRRLRARTRSGHGRIVSRDAFEQRYLRRALHRRIRLRPEARSVARPRRAHLHRMHRRFHLAFALYERASLPHADQISVQAAQRRARQAHRRLRLLRGHRARRRGKHAR